MFIVNIKKSTILTYLGVIFATISMYFAFTKIAFSEIGYLRFSLIFLMLAGICDMFDGKVARACKRTEEEKEFGVQLDSLADTVNFVVLPIIIMLSLGLTTILDLVIYAFFIICGISRLGYFNIHANLDGPVSTYTGLPVTSTAIIYPVLGLLHGIIPEDIFCIMYIMVTLLIGFLFIANIKIPKLKGIAYIIIPILAIILTVLLLIVK